MLAVEASGGCWSSRIFYVGKLGFYFYSRDSLELESEQTDRKLRDIGVLFVLPTVNVSNAYLGFPQTVSFFVGEIEGGAQCVWHTGGGRDRVECRVP